MKWVLWSGAPFCRAGDPSIGVVAVDPKRFRFRIFHYAGEGLQRPPGIWKWMHLSGALVLFNAGQYYPDFSYMGLLVSNGVSIRSKLHPSFQALFVAEPRDPTLPPARILDLSMDPFDPQDLRYREVAQSFMLLDRTGRIRVRNSQKVANRTAVGEGTDGRIWIFTTHGGYTLWDFARLLDSSGLPLKQVMAMDGGYEAQMIIHVGRFVYDNLGFFTPGGSDRFPREGGRRPLPTVIGVLPRGKHGLEGIGP
jgi:uncharacterized protein YigE (DUF2233 family)